jgi:Sec-independent protein translocase protein TatA
MLQIKIKGIIVLLVAMKVVLGPKRLKELKAKDLRAKTVVFTESNILKNIKKICDNK